MQIVTIDPVKYADFFQTVTSRSPFDYQRRLGTEPWPDILDIPTGLGKTAAVVVAWLWKRLHRDIDTPRRLVYCLPMRVLVEQTQANVQTWLANVAAMFKQREMEPPGVYLLMGGEMEEDWESHPENDAILIGTQDMLLSRALMRGYGMSRYKWPVHFGLLHNDALWVFDEIQLMGAGLATSAQLEAFRSELWRPLVPSRSLWMSATVSEEFLQTRDRIDLGCKVGGSLTLSGNDFNSKQIHSRFCAEKSIEVSKLPKPTTRQNTGIIDCQPTGRLTLVILNTVSAAQEMFFQLREVTGSQSKGKLKVSRPAIKLLHGRFRPCDRKKKMANLLGFIRQQDAQTGAVDGHPGFILVATQVVEAGLDISAARLWSEIAPWPSCIQRLGRLNREGVQSEAKAVWWMPKADAKGENASEAPNAKRTGPYEKEDLKKSANLLNQLGTLQKQGGISYRCALDQVLASDESQAALSFDPETVVRPDDLYGLFATEPDLAGGFTDVSHFVRDQDRNADVLLFWRVFDPKRGPASDESPPVREELCPVPFYELRKFLGDKAAAWEWDFEDGRWLRRRKPDIYPGMTLLLANTQGGYSEELGWTGDASDLPSPITGGAQRSWPGLDALASDPASQADTWVSLPQHLADAEREATAILTALEITDTAEGKAVAGSARRHDWGKALGRWQAKVVDHVSRVIKKCDEVLQDLAMNELHAVVTSFRQVLQEPDSHGVPWAKWPDARRLWLDPGLTVEQRTLLKKRLATPFRPGLRHEAASALAAWEAWRQGDESLSALAVYLIASHHGKVRTLLRAGANTAEVFGLRQDDALPPIPGFDMHSGVLPLHISKIGSSGRWLTEEQFVPEEFSWVAMMHELTGSEAISIPAANEVIPLSEPRNLGPFTLAYLEALLRAADVRASRCPGGTKP